MWGAMRSIRIYACATRWRCGRSAQRRERSALPFRQAAWPARASTGRRFEERAELCALLHLGALLRTPVVLAPPGHGSARLTDDANLPPQARRPGLRLRHDVAEPAR